MSSEYFYRCQSQKIPLQKPRGFLLEELVVHECEARPLFKPRELDTGHVKVQAPFLKKKKNSVRNPRGATSTENVPSSP